MLAHILTSLFVKCLGDPTEPNPALAIIRVQHMLSLSYDDAQALIDTIASAASRPIIAEMRKTEREYRVSHGWGA